MLKKNILAILILIVLASVSLAEWPDPQKGTLSFYWITGTVTTPEGQPLVSVATREVIFYKDDPTLEVVTTTDNNGAYRFNAFELYYFEGISIEVGTTYNIGVSEEGGYYTPAQPITIEAADNYLIQNMQLQGFDENPPTINITSPTTLDAWVAGSSHNITWTTTDESGIKPNSINIYYSTDEGSSWHLIANNETNDGTYLWQAVNFITTEAKIRITAIDNSPKENLGTAESGTYNIISPIGYYVNINTGNNSNNGLTSEAGIGNNGPWKNISYAITQAAESIPIYAANGTYNSGAGETYPINMGSNKILISQNTGLATIDAGSSANNVITMDSNCTLEGFTILTSASGYYCVSAEGGSHINNNTLSSLDRGIFLYGNNSLIENNSITCAGSGGYALVIEQNTNNYTINSNIITGNDSGYGIYAAQTYTGNISYNEIRNFGTGSYLNPSNTHTINYFNNTVVKNITYGINRGSTGTINIYNCIVAKDPEGGTSSGTGIINSGGATNLTYSDFYGNATNYNGVTSGTGTISANARFVNSAGNNYWLLNNSPCIDTGDPSSPLEADGTRVDMGCYPYIMNAGTDPAVRIISPNGGETWEVYSTHNITWYATQPADVIDYINLHYSIDSGATYPYTITTEAPNTGTFAWTVPKALTTEAKVRIQAIASLGTDESDSVFTIISGDRSAPTIESTSPSTGDAWAVGSYQNITWTITDESGIKPNSISIYLSTDEGTTWMPITTGEDNDGIYLWQVFDYPTTEAKIRITAIDNSGNDNLGTFESGIFSIIEGAVVPAFTQSLRATIINAKVVLDWRHTFEAASYNIYRDIMPTFEANAGNRISTEVQGSQYDGGLRREWTDQASAYAVTSEALNYYYLVKAVNGTFESMSSNKVGEYTFALPKYPPTSYIWISYVLDTNNSRDPISTAGELRDKIPNIDTGYPQYFNTTNQQPLYNSSHVLISGEVLQIKVTAEAIYTFAGGVFTGESFSLTTNPPTNYTWISMPINHEPMTLGQLQSQISNIDTGYPQYYNTQNQQPLYEGGRIIYGGTPIQIKSTGTTIWP